MSNGNIWRFTNNGTPGAGNGDAIIDLPANRTADVPAELVSIFWDSDGPGTVIDQIFIQNQTFVIYPANAAGNVDPFTISSSGSENVARAQLIENAGFGRVLFDQSA